MQETCCLKNPCRDRVDSAGSYNVVYGTNIVTYPSCPERFRPAPGHCSGRTCHKPAEHRRSCRGPSLGGTCETMRARLTQGIGSRSQVSVARLRPELCPPLPTRFSVLDGESLPHAGSEGVTVPGRVVEGLIPVGQTPTPWSVLTLREGRRLRGDKGTGIRPRFRVGKGKLNAGRWDA